MNKKPKTQPEAQPIGFGGESPEPKPMSQVIVVLHDNAMIGQTTFSAGTVLGHIAPSGSVTLGQLCSAILHGKAGVRSENE